MLPCTFIGLNCLNLHLDFTNENFKLVLITNHGFLVSYTIGKVCLLSTNLGHLPNYATRKICFLTTTRAQVEIAAQDFAETLDCVHVRLERPRKKYVVDEGVGLFTESFHTNS